MTQPVQSSTSVSGVGAAPVGQGSTNLGDLLERVLDRGVVIAGDIRVSLLDIELLTVKLRLVIASVDTARQMGIDWWEYDPWLTSRRQSSVEGRRRDAVTGDSRRGPGAEDARARDRSGAKGRRREAGTDEPTGREDDDD